MLELVAASRVTASDYNRAPTTLLGHRASLSDSAQLALQSLNNEELRAARSQVNAT
jgi:hypothetical protein